MAQSLAINGNDFALAQLPYGLHPTQKALLQPLGVERGKQTSYRVVRRNAVWQRQKSSQPLFLGPAIILDIDLAIRPADNRTDAERNDIE